MSKFWVIDNIVFELRFFIHLWKRVHRVVAVGAQWGDNAPGHDYLSLIRLIIWWSSELGLVRVRLIFCPSAQAACTVLLCDGKGQHCDPETLKWRRLLGCVRIFTRGRSRANRSHANAVTSQSHLVGIRVLPFQIEHWKHRSVSLRH